MSTTRVLVVGQVARERIGSALELSGPAYFAARAHRSLGAEVGLAAAFDPEVDAHAAIPGVEPIVRGGAEARVSRLYPGAGRYLMRLESPGAPLAPREIPARWQNVDLLHLAPLLGEVDVREWRTAIGAKHVALGAQGFVREAGPDGIVVPSRWNPDPASLEGVDSICLHEADLVEEDDLVERLRNIVPVVVVTRGRNGCDVWAIGRRTHVGIFQTKQVDPVGAGETFAASLFLALTRGEDPVHAARLGAAAASLAVEALGAEGLDRLAEAAVRARDIGAN
jgi:hypothetical protein